MAKFDTKRIRASYNSCCHGDSVNVPIYQTAAFDLRTPQRAERLWTLEEDGPLYTRVGNPTVEIYAERVKELDGAYAAVALSSGMAAVSYTVLALTEGGGNIVSSSALYGGTEDAFSHFFPRFGASFRFVKDRFSPQAYEAEIDENTRGIFIESINNPNAELYDVEAIAEIAHKHKIPLIVDNTVATPYLFQPLKYGADIVIYSATKALSGHGNIIAGIIEESGTFTYSRDKFPQFYQDSYKLKNLKGKRRSSYEVDPKSPLIIHLKAFYLEFFGAALGPFDAYLGLQGLCTISERVKKQVENAEKIVKYLESRSDILWVRHPKTQGSPFKELAAKYFPKGAGYILSFAFPGNRQQFSKFIEELHYFSYHPNIGDVRSLIIDPTKTTHAEMDAFHLERAGIEPNLIRISAGVEDADDLIEDLDQAFQSVFGNSGKE